MNNELKQIKITVNDKVYIVKADPEKSLLDFLRRDLGLTGAKNGCDQKGICGACTVIVNGQARKSCLLKMNQLDGAIVTTIEGLSEAGKLHPLQKAFIAAGAVQCGFCTPGMIMAAKALLDHNPSPTREEIIRALQGNLCRCGTYEKVIKAVQMVAANNIPKETAGRPPVEIGAPLPPKMSVEKVTGRLKFADDLQENDVAIGKIVWAGFPHAEIRGINITEAVQVPGVIAVLTAKDIPGRNAFGLIHPDQPVLAADKVRYLGDPVALVIGENETAALEGRNLVQVEYKELNPVYSPEEALTTGAPIIHPKGNQVCEFHLKRGDIDAGFRDSDVIVEDRFTTPAVEHAYLEPEAGIAEWDGETVIIRAGCQYPQVIQRQIASVLNLPEDKVRVISHPTGGAFGGKTSISIHALLALAAYVTKLKVKITLTREESLKASVKRHPMTMTYRIGFSRDGHIKAVSGDILADCGAYETLSFPVLEQTTAFSTGPYTVPNALIRTRGVFTNNPPSSAFRGFGIPQPTFAVESLVDEAAVRLGISPIEIRKVNALKPGSRTVTGQILGVDTHLLETLETVEQDYIAIKDKSFAGRGVGVACGYKNVGLGLGENDYAHAEIEIFPQGRILLRTGAIDLGQGACTVLAQIAAHELGVGYEEVDVEMGDTALDPDARETNASRQTVMSGNAVLNAVGNLKNSALEMAERLLPKFESKGAKIKDGSVIDGAGKHFSLFELARIVAEKGGRLAGWGTYTAPRTFPIGSTDGNRNYLSYGFFSNLAVVDVDKGTGRTKVKMLISAYDVGKAINKLTVEGQLEGGAVMGMGYALSEEYHAYAPNPTVNLAQCGVPRFVSLPDKLDVRLIEPADSSGPYGAKGVGEMAMVAVAPAITNAIRDAIGVRVTDLPAKPERIRALLKREGQI